MATQLFSLKEARQRVYSCIKHFVQLNSLGSEEGAQDGSSGSTVCSTTPSEPGLPPPPLQWAEFVRSTNSSSYHGTGTAGMDTSGKCVKGVLSCKLAGCGFISWKIEWKNAESNPYVRVYGYFLEE